MAEATGSLVAAVLFLGLALVSSLGGDDDRPAHVALLGRSVDARILAALCLAGAAAFGAKAVIAWRTRRRNGRRANPT